MAATKAVPTTALIEAPLVLPPVELPLAVVELEPEGVVLLVLLTAMLLT